MTNTLREMWSEPGATSPAPRVWRDWVFFAVIVVAMLVEGAVRPDLVWPYAVVPMGVALASTVLWRRTHPLAMVVIAFGVFNAASAAAFFIADKPITLYGGIFLLSLIYSLFRWGTYRDAALGLVVMAMALAVGSVTDSASLEDVIGGAAVLLLSAGVGIQVRHQLVVRRQRMEKFKLEERQQLARELHDTVAHHVSAIAIQAQAGRFLAGKSSLEGAAGALEAIEEEASRTLAEMRSIVGILRDGGVDPEMAPRRRIADIEDLATTFGVEGLSIVVETVGDLSSVQPSVEAAVYRLAQESITNTIRHARHATLVELRVDGGEDEVELTVLDNGRAPSSIISTSGYGLVGMSERTALLGGTFEAGPGSDRGWMVRATFPRRAGAS